MLETHFLISLLDLDWRGSGSVLQLDLAYPFFKLHHLLSQLFGFVSCRNRLEVLARAEHEAVRQKRPRDSDRCEPAYDPRAYRSRNRSILNLFVWKETVCHGHYLLISEQ